MASNPEGARVHHYKRARQWNREHVEEKKVKKHECVEEGGEGRECLLGNIVWRASVFCIYYSVCLNLFPLKNLTAAEMRKYFG